MKLVEPSMFCNHHSVVDIQHCVFLIECLTIDTR